MSDDSPLYQSLTDLANEVAEIADALDSTNSLRASQLGNIAHRIAGLRTVQSEILPTVQLEYPSGNDVGCVTLPSGERWAVAGKVARYVNELKSAQSAPTNAATQGHPDGEQSLRAEGRESISGNASSVVPAVAAPSAGTRADAASHGVLPECMIPDGAEPCAAYQYLERELAEAKPVQSATFSATFPTAREVWIDLVKREVILSFDKLKDAKVAYAAIGGKSND